MNNCINTKEIGARIRALRIKNGFTQQKLADALQQKDNVKVIAHPLEGQNPYRRETQAAKGQQCHRYPVVRLVLEQYRVILRRIQMPAWTQVTEDQFTTAFFDGKTFLHSLSVFAQDEENTITVHQKRYLSAG